jgi:cytochrome c-type biogenesis protein
MGYNSTRKTLITIYLIILFLTLLGFLGYYFGFLGFIYNIAMPKAFSNFNIVLLSVIFGIAAFFSPCAFTVLPAYITYHITSEEKEETSKLSKSLYLGVLAALGIIVVNMVVGLVIAALGSAAPFHKDPRNDIALVLGVRIVIGVIITILGIMTVSGKGFRVPFVQKLISKAGFKKSFFYYGIFYNAAAVGCTGPIMLGLMLYAFSTGSFVSALTAFAIFSATMAFLMILMTVLVGAFKGAFIQQINKALPKIKIVTGIIMIMVGLFLTILTLEGNKLFVKLFFPYL